MTTQDILALWKAEAEKHGFGHIPIKTDTSRKRLGGCAHRGTEIVYFIFSSVLLPLCPDADILDTIRHEIAHAKTPGAHHGHMWQLAAIAIGAKPQPCASVDIDAKMAGYKYIAACSCSPTMHGKTRRVTRRLICSTCRQRLEFIQQY